MTVTAPVKRGRLCMIGVGFISMLIEDSCIITLPYWFVFELSGLTRIKARSLDTAPSTGIGWGDKETG